MKITAIEPQKRRAGRWSIFIDGSYRFALAEHLLLEAGLKLGDELAESRLAELLQLADDAKVLDRAYVFLSYRPRSRYEMVIYLSGKGYPEEQVDHIVARLEEQNFLDDTQFARDWVANRQALNPRSSIELRSELRKKGIGSSIIDEVLGEIDQATEAAAVLALIDQKKLLVRYGDEQKLIRYLASKGFSYGVIKQALENDDD